MNRSSKIVAVAVVAAAMPWLVASASAAPISAPRGLENAATTSFETVQYYRRGWRRGGRFLGPAIAGAIIGGAIIGATQPYPYGPYYYGPGPAYVVAPNPYPANAIAYCQQRFRSYDPASGTYLGYDGLRHPCP